MHGTEIKIMYQSSFLLRLWPSLFCFMHLQSIDKGTQASEQASCKLGQFHRCFHILEESLSGQFHCTRVPITRNVSDATWRTDMSVPSVGRSDLRKPRRQILLF